MASPEEVFEVARALPVQSAVDFVKAYREIWRQKSQPVSTPVGIFTVMALIDAEFLVGLWAPSIQSLVIQAEYYQFSDIARRLLERDNTGFGVVDYFAYHPDIILRYKNHHEVTRTIVGLGAERYKQIYSALTGLPYTPRS